MAGKIDAFLKVCVALSALAVAASVAHYYTVYLPGRDQQANTERLNEKARAELLRRTNEARATAELEAKIERENLDKAQTQARYERCKQRASENYTAGWAAACKAANAKSIKDRSSCTFSPSACDNLHPVRDPSPSCTLYGNSGTDLNASLEKARDRCLQESRAGVQ
ncbi:MAG: hypothetical protein Q7V17_14925 [Afipia sp.]|nr:hypothetical protein [Afipia sp.]